jgi:hypothetical protein
LRLALCRRKQSRRAAHETRGRRGGSWARVLREGFDAFLARDMATAARRYTEAALMGYSRGAENAAWLLRNELQAASSCRCCGLPQLRPRELLHERCRRPASARDELFRRMDRPLPPLQRLAQGELRLALGRERDAVRSWARARPAPERLFRAAIVLGGHRAPNPRYVQRPSRIALFGDDEQSQAGSSASHRSTHA